MTKQVSRVPDESGKCAWIGFEQGRIAVCGVGGYV